MSLEAGRGIPCRPNPAATLFVKAVSDQWPQFSGHRVQCVDVELVITAGGKNIAPVRIEDAVRKRLPCLSNCMLVGDQRNFLALLITLKASF